MTQQDIISSIWGNMMDAIEEDNFHCFTQVAMMKYLGKTLATSKMWQQLYLNKEQAIKKMVNPKLCCLEFLNIKLDVFPGCTNKQCSRPLNLLRGAKIVACHHCSRTMRTDKCSCAFHLGMSFEDKLLTLLIEVVSAFLKKGVINMTQTDIDTFKKNCCS